MKEDLEYWLSLLDIAEAKNTTMFRVLEMISTKL